MNKMHIDALKYVGGKDEQTFTVLPFQVDDAEREITFTKEQIKISGIDITGKALRFLVRDYPRSFKHIQKEIEANKLFEMRLPQLIDEHGLNEQSVRSVINRIYKKDQTFSPKSRVASVNGRQEINGGIDV